MSPTSVLAIVLSFAAFAMFSARPTANRALFFFGLVTLHFAACIASYAYFQTNVTDATGYYYDSLGMNRWPFQLGTVFTVKLVQFLKDIIGGSYFDYFLLFQTFGIWGLALLMRTFEEIHELAGVPPTTASYLLLVLPGLHFWTSFIGKDAPLFFAVAICVWATIRLRRRLVGFAIGVGLMVLFRPHIALVTTIALAGAAFFARGTGPLARVVLVVVAAAAAGYIATTLESTFHIRFSSADAVFDWFARQGEISKQFTSGSAVMNASFPFRLFSLLFRPLFLDAATPMALVASLENLVMLFVIGFLIFKWRQMVRVARSAFFVQFAAIFAVVLTILLATVYYNVGLGLRQRTMIMPALLTVFMALWAVRQRQRAELHAPVPVAPGAVYGPASPS
ncbi:MAG TPA: hypothetical protein VFK58_04835 [Sphingomicrobium sp.]|nr:hypothetical protein [Sphingomicrobium sp.]